MVGTRGSIYIISEYVSQFEEEESKNQCNGITSQQINQHELMPVTNKNTTTKALTSRVSSLFACELRNRAVCCVSLESAKYRQSVCSSTKTRLTHPPCKLPTAFSTCHRPGLPFLLPLPLLHRCLLQTTHSNQTTRTLPRRLHPLLY